MMIIIFSLAPSEALYKDNLNNDQLSIIMIINYHLTTGEEEDARNCRRNMSGQGEKGQGGNLVTIAHSSKYIHPHLFIQIHSSTWTRRVSEAT